MNISYIDDKIDMHLPYESSGDNKKDENRTINENHMDIIIENEMKKNESETNVDDSSWPNSFHEIAIDETTDVINRKRSIIQAEPYLHSGMGQVSFYKEALIFFSWGVDFKR